MTGKRPRVCVLGDITHFQYHPFGDVAVVLKEGLSEAGFHVDCTEDRDILQKLEDYDLILCYLDMWGEPMTSAQLEGVRQFVARGKGLIAVHCGISPENPEFHSLFGGRFIGHPPIQELSVRVIKGEATMTRDLEDFNIVEELYQFEWLGRSDLRVFLEVVWEGQSYPFAWTRTEGQGRIAYFAPGHTAEVLKHPMVMKALARTAAWAVRQ